MAAFVPRLLNSESCDDCFVKDREGVSTIEKPSRCPVEHILTVERVGVAEIGRAVELEDHVAPGRRGK